MIYFSGCKCCINCTNAKVDVYSDLDLVEFEYKPSDSVSCCMCSKKENETTERTKTSD